MNPKIKEIAKRSAIWYVTDREDLLQDFADILLADVIQNLEIHAGCFDGDEGRGIKTAVRLTKEKFGIVKKCRDCNKVGMSHCSDPANCGGPWDERTN